MTAATLCWDYITIERPAYTSDWPSADEFMTAPWEPYSFWATVNEVACDTCPAVLRGIDAHADAMQDGWIRWPYRDHPAPDINQFGPYDMCPECQAQLANVEGV